MSVRGAHRVSSTALQKKKKREEGGIGLTKWVVKEVLKHMETA